MELFIIIARSIWLRRNKLIFEGFFQHPTQIVNISKLYLEDFKTVNDRYQTINRGRQVINTSWNPPPAGFLKINWDAAISVEKGRIGLGLIARDQGGNIVGTKKLTQAGFNDPLLAEALGAFQAVIMAMEIGIDCVIFEGDSSQVVKGIYSHVERWDRVGMVLSDIRMQLPSFASWKFLFVKRSGNTLAHDLAKSSLDEDSIVLDLIPDCNHVTSEI